LISQFHPSKVFILLLASCLIWIGGISLAVAFFLGTAVTTGWIIGGALLLGALVWILVMFREIRDAIELPDYLAQDGSNGIGAERTSSTCSREFRSEMRAAFERSGMESRSLGRRLRRRSRGGKGTHGQAVSKR
jgi:hypothetical protein